MQKPVLYLDIVGTLLVDKGGELERAAYSAAFLDATRPKFRIKFLSALEEHQARAVARGFDIDAEYVPFRRGLGKASSINFKEDFYWIDDDPTPADLLRLADERCSDRLIPVNRREGVTEATFRKLMATVQEKAQPKD